MTDLERIDTTIKAAQEMYELSLKLDKESIVVKKHKERLDYLLRTRQAIINDSMKDVHDLTVDPDDLPENGTVVMLLVRGTDVIRTFNGESFEHAVERCSKIETVTAGWHTEEGWCGMDGYPMIVRPAKWKNITW